MASTLYKIALFVLALACAACGDDDSDPPPTDQPDGSMDASMDASEPHDASEPDSSVQPDGSIDKDSSSDPDGGDSGMCELVEEPLLDNFETPFNAVRVPLSAFCRDGCDTLAELAEPFDCTELEGDASIEDLELTEDAGSGCCFNWWIRTEGCGNVQYRTYRSWHSISNFDAETGERIGAAFQSDITEDFGGCRHYAFVAGELLHDCPDATESICVR